MKIMDFLEQDAISCNLASTDKKSVIKELVGLLVKAAAIQRGGDKLITTLLNREELGSTGIGQGVGIPHAKSPLVKKLVGAFGLSKNGVNFDSLDGEPVYIFFLLIAPEDSAGPHLKALARISRLLKDKYLRDALRQAKDESEIVRILKEEDQRKY